MSHIVFGDFKLDLMNEHSFEKLRKEAYSKGVLFHFNDEINFYKDIRKMLLENVDIDNNCIFCITSSNQEYNSDDLLFPDDKYTEEELFPDGDDRKHFEDLCFQNIIILKNAILSLSEVLNVSNLRVFVVGGYDDNFITMKCNEAEMAQDIFEQVINSFNLKSKIYKIN